MTFKNLIRILPPIEGQRKGDRKDLFVEVLYRIGFHLGITMPLFLILLSILFKIPNGIKILYIGAIIFLLSFLIQGLFAIKAKRVISFAPWPDFIRGGWAQAMGVTQALLCTVLLLIIYYTFQEIPLGSFSTIILPSFILYLVVNAMTIFSTNR